jgi:two-component system NarL family sensor kinase
MNVTGPSWRKLTGRELRLLSTIAYQVGIAVERARLAEQSTRLARAEERTRLAREIHDTLAQELTAIALHLEAAAAAVRTDPARAEEWLSKALTLARGSLEEARHAVVDLRTSPLAGRSLPEALGALARAFTAETGIRVHVKAEETSLAVSVEEELYRIAQEAFTNIRKHAQAREVDLRLRSSGGRVRLRLEDDGRGFVRAGARRAGGGYGLIGMRERAKLLGGAVRIGSRPGGGTRLIVTVPLANQRVAS